MTRLLGHNRIGTWNMKYPLLPNKVRVFNGQCFFVLFFKLFGNVIWSKEYPFLSVIKVIFRFQCATWISSLTTISIQWQTSWSLEGKIIKTSEGTSGRGCDFLNLGAENFMKESYPLLISTGFFSLKPRTEKKFQSALKKNPSLK